eukprot:3539474-Ditylum_brightwellii.AAC.1
MFLEDKGKKASALTGFTIVDIAMNVDLQEEKKERLEVDHAFSMSHRVARGVAGGHCFHQSKELIYHGT